MTEPSADDVRLALLATSDAMERLTMQLIAAELAMLRPIYDSNITTRTRTAKVALEALDGPEKALAELDAEIGQVRAKCSSLAEATYGGDVAGRVSSRQEYAAWEIELGLLEQRRDELAQELDQLQAEANRTRSGAESAIAGKAMSEDAILCPFESELGQRTNAYAQFRMPQTWQVIVAGDRKHPEWDQAIAQLRQLCVMSGYRTENDPQVEAGQARLAVAMQGLARPGRQGGTSVTPRGSPLGALVCRRENNAPKRRREHPLKQDRRWTVQQHPDGSFT